MQNVVWGAIPTQRSKKEEQFNTPVVTMSALKGLGAGRKFSFNKAAQEILGIQGEDSVMFGFDTNSLAIFITKSALTEGTFKLTKTCTFSDKKTFEFIAKRLELDTEVENHFDLTLGMNEGTCEMILRTPLTVGMENLANGKEVTSFQSMDLGEITVEDNIVPISEIIDEDIEETEETLTATARAIAEEETEEEVGVTQIPETEEEDLWD